jgi:hypothetical protein
MIKNYVPNHILSKFVYMYIKKIHIMNKQKLTSVKIDEDLFEDFRVECVRRKFSLQKLTERAIHLYLTDNEFKKQIHNHINYNKEK